MDRLLRRGPATAAAAAVALILPLAASSLQVRHDYHAPGADAPPFPLGVTFHGFWNYDSRAEMEQALELFADAGGTWVRIDLGWGAVETEPDEYSPWALARYDTVIDAAHREGLHILLVLQRTPDWANGSDDHALAPWDVTEFGDFAVDMANRYAGKVQAIELWNEPNHRDFFKARKPGQEAREHTAMVQDAYTKIKGHGPRGSEAVTVLAGGSSHVDVGWWSQLYAAGIKDYTDVVAVNPYPMPADLPPDAEADGTRYRMTALGALTELLQEEGDGAKPIWFTEFGWSSHRNTPETALWDRGVTEEQQAAYFGDTVALLKTDYPQVQQIFWYNLRNRDDGDSVHQHNFGLLERDLTPKPVLRLVAEIYGGG